MGLCHPLVPGPIRVTVSLVCASYEQPSLETHTLRDRAAPYLFASHLGIPSPLLVQDIIFLSSP